MAQNIYISTLVGLRLVQLILAETRFESTREILTYFYEKLFNRKIIYAVEDEKRVNALVIFNFLSASCHIRLRNIIQYKIDFSISWNIF